MKKFMLVLGLTAAVALLAVIPGALGRSQATPASRARDHDRHHAAAQRAGRALRAHRHGHEGVLQLHQRAQVEGRRQARRLRAPDHAEHLRRRLPGGEHRPADAPRGRAGPRLRDARRPRHREPAGRPRLPEPEEGAAALRLDRAQRLRATQELPVDDRLAAGLRPGGHPAREVRQGRTSRARKSACSSRTTTTARRSSPASRSASAKQRDRRVARLPAERRRAPRSRRSSRS